MRKALSLALLLLALALPGAARAQVTDQTRMVYKASNVLERLRGDSGINADLTAKLARAKGVLIIPDMVKAGFIFGAEYGTGVLLTKADNGSWSGPAFYSIASGSFGLQIGAQDSETVFVIMSDGALNAVVNNEFKAGAGLSVAVATMGAGMQANTTTNVGADMYAYSKAVGLYGGVSLDGAGILPRHSWNSAYYGGNPTPEAILFDHAVDNPQADKLRDVLAR